MLFTLYRVNQRVAFVTWPVVSKGHVWPTTLIHSSLNTIIPWLLLEIIYNLFTIWLEKGTQMLLE